MRVLLIDTKMPNFPQIPIIRELGYNEDLVTTWFAVFAPAGIPEEVKKVLIPAIEKGVKLTKPKIDNMASLVVYKSLLELKKMIEDEYKKALEIAKIIGLRK
jgi:tripartite-type tricarboxylate transporter receptor subunit TctC